MCVWAEKTWISEEKQSCLLSNCWILGAGFFQFFRSDGLEKLGF
jgi:hypothetical protein